MKDQLPALLAAFLAAIICCDILLIAIPYHRTSTLGSASPGIAASYATSSAIAVSTTASTAVATSTCAARVVSTTGNSAIMLTFNDKYTPTGIFGLWQAASTTVAYDGGLYGCGKLKIYSFVAQTITVTDVR